MRIKTVSVTYGRKVNLSDFNSAAIECSMWADVDVEDDLDVSMGALWSMAKENVKAQCLPLVNNGKAEVRKFYLGLPTANPQPEHAAHTEICRECGFEFCQVTRWKEGEYWYEKRTCERCGSISDSKTSALAAIGQKQQE